jgi:hypothetical protein
VSDPAQSARLSKDRTEVLRRRELLRSWKVERDSRDRLLAIIVATHESDRLLAGSLPNLFRQSKELGVGIDVILGLNNGYEPSCLTTVAPGDAQSVLHLYSAPRRSAACPADIFDNQKLTGAPFSLSSEREVKSTKPNLIIVHQPEGRYEPGKIRLLSDIYQLLWNGTFAGWRAPRFILTLDTESHLVSHFPDQGPSLDGNGLGLLLSTMKVRDNLDLLGARNSFCIYHDKEGRAIPDFASKVHPLYDLMNVVHGRVDGFKWLPGGGTIGKYEVVLSILSTICAHYPSARVEDVQATILAVNSGFICDFAEHVIATNRCYEYDDADERGRRALVQQWLRWMKGIMALAALYGDNAIKPVLRIDGTGMTDSASGLVEKAFITKMADRARFYQSLRSAVPLLQKLREQALRNPDQPGDPRSPSYWRY